MNNIENRKPIYSFDKELVCGIIDYNDKKYYMNIEDRDRIINFDKNFVFISNNDIYPSYCINYKRINYLEFIYKFTSDNIYYTFKNGNQLDLRRCNVICYPLFHKTIIEKYDFVEYREGHYCTMGHEANIMKNPIWKIKEKEKEYLLILCKNDILCKVCLEGYQKIIDFENNINNGKKITWFKLQNGYIMGSNNLYIHKIITSCYGNGKGTKNISVDHIDQNPLNNTMENLRISTRKEQEQNSKGIKEGAKRERKHIAKPLPEGITQEMMKKYVVYYHEWLNPEKTRSREFFKIEKHPKLEKIYVGTKSNKISIQEKLNQINHVVDGLENNIHPSKTI